MVALYTTVFLASMVISIMLGLPIAFSLILSGASTALAMGGGTRPTPRPWPTSLCGESGCPVHQGGAYQTDHRLL
jgi:hypothetical protein